ncbi:helicase associated domain-containing protein [Vibrio sp. D431a]|uniref:helicase associated domain-containing protein n=1 Tax=Vibrio sp. D431a TaxID=2837388 RepID=UPI002553EF26|nr:helicase associated domain-containing protein [Vibrio sp. D431a]
MGSGAAFGLSLYFLVYLCLAPVRHYLDGRLALGASFAALIPAIALTPFVINKMWFNNYKQLESYLEQNPSCELTRDYVDSDGYGIGQWSLERYREYAANDMRGERKEALEKISFMKKCSSNPNFI